MISKDREAPIIKNVPTSITVEKDDNSFELTTWIDENITISDKVTKEISYNLNNGGFDIHVFGEYSAEDEAKNIAESSFIIKIEELSLTHDAYIEATTLTLSDLTTGSFGGTVHSLSLTIMQSDEI